MTRPLKLLLGLATLWPVVYLVCFLGFWFFLMMWMVSRSPDESEMPFGMMRVFFILHGITIVWILGLLAFYLYHLFQTDRVKNDQKALWAVVLFLGNAIAMPIYWYLYIWRERAPPR